MLDRVRLALPLATLVACGSAPRASPGGAATPIVWNAGNGWFSLTVDGAGVATYDFHPTGFDAQGRTPETERLALTTSGVHQLELAIAAHHPCALHASGRLPVPEEGTQSLVLAIPGATCTVEIVEPTNFSPLPRSPSRNLGNPKGDQPPAIRRSSVRTLSS